MQAKSAATPVVTGITFGNDDQDSVHYFQRLCETLRGYHAEVYFSEDDGESKCIEGKLDPCATVLSLTNDDADDLTRYNVPWRLVRQIDVS